MSLLTLLHEPPDAPHEGEDEQQNDDIAVESPAIYPEDDDEYDVDCSVVQDGEEFDGIESEEEEEDTVCIAPWETSGAERLPMNGYEWQECEPI